MEVDSDRCVFAGWGDLFSVCPFSEWVNEEAGSFISRDVPSLPEEFCEEETWPLHFRLGRHQHSLQVCSPRIP